MQGLFNRTLLCPNSPSLKTASQYRKLIACTRSSWYPAGHRLYSSVRPEKPYYVTTPIFYVNAGKKPFFAQGLHD